MGREKMVANAEKRVWVQGGEGLHREFRDVRECSRMFGNVRRCSENVLWMARAKLWTARAVDGLLVAGACPGLAGSSQFNWSQPQNYVRRQAAPASDGIACSVDADKCGCCGLYVCALFRRGSGGTQHLPLPNSLHSQSAGLWVETA